MRMHQPRIWDDEFDREFYSDEEIHESDERVQKIVEESISRGC